MKIQENSESLEEREDKTGEGGGVVKPGKKRKKKTRKPAALDIQQ
jgi:hypothetical protein